MLNFEHNISPLHKTPQSLLVYAVCLETNVRHISKA